MEAIFYLFLFLWHTSTFEIQLKNIEK